MCANEDPNGWQSGWLPPRPRIFLLYLKPKSKNVAQRAKIPSNRIVHVQNRFSNWKIAHAHRASRTHSIHRSQQERRILFHFFYNLQKLNSNRCIDRKDKKYLATWKISADFWACYDGGRGGGAREIVSVGASQSTRGKKNYMEKMAWIAILLNFWAAQELCSVNLSLSLSLASLLLALTRKYGARHIGGKCNQFTYILDCIIPCIEICISSAQIIMPLCQ